MMNLPPASDNENAEKKEEGYNCSLYKTVLGNNHAHGRHQMVDQGENKQQIILLNHSHGFFQFLLRDIKLNCFVLLSA